MQVNVNHSLLKRRICNPNFNLIVLNQSLACKYILLESRLEYISYILKPQCKWWQTVSVRLARELPRTRLTKQFHRVMAHCFEAKLIEISLYIPRNIWIANRRNLQDKLDAQNASEILFITSSHQEIEQQQKSCMQRKTLQGFLQYKMKINIQTKRDV